MEVEEKKEVAEEKKEVAEEKKEEVPIVEEEKEEGKPVVEEKEEAKEKKEAKEKASESVLQGVKDGVIAFHKDRVQMGIESLTRYANQRIDFCDEMQNKCASLINLLGYTAEEIRDSNLRLKSYGDDEAAYAAALDALDAAACAVCTMGLAGERAAAKSAATGTFRTLLIDELSLMDESILKGGIACAIR